MGALVRIALYVFAGWLYSSGLVGEHVRDLIAHDPELAEMAQIALAFLVQILTMLWWRLARRRGWPL